MDSFALRLRKLRNHRGWSQEYVGFELGVTKATISKWETGRAEPSLRHLECLRQLYASDGATLDMLIIGTPMTRNVRDGASLDGDETRLLWLFRRLTDIQKQGLLTLLDGKESQTELRELNASERHLP